MNIQNNKIYHRAGVNFLSENGIKLFQNDCKTLGESIGVEVQCFSVNFSNHPNSNYISIINNDNIWPQTILSELSDPQSSCIEEEKIFIPEDKNVHTKQANIILFPLTWNQDNSYFFMISISPWHPSNELPDASYGGARVRYDIIHNDQYIYYSANLNQASSSAYYGSGFRWNIAISQKGGALSSFFASSASSSSINELTFYSSVYSLEDEKQPFHILKSSNLSIFFTKLQNLNNSSEPEAPAIFFVNAKEPEIDDSTGKNYSSFKACCLSPCLSTIEVFPNEFFADALADRKGTIPVLTSMTSKISDYYAPYLYIKETSNEKLFGVVQLGTKKFIAGSYYCLACGEESGS